MSLYKLNKDMLIKIILKIEENNIKNMNDFELNQLYYKIAFERSRRFPMQGASTTEYDSYLPN